MKVFFESSSSSYFPLYKLTLVPGENTIPDDVGKEILDAHNEECKRGGDKPRIRLVPKAASAPPVVTSAKPKKGVKF